MIEIKGLTKRFGKKTVVEDVTVKIEPGTITSFIGPNGAGKSTLLINGKSFIRCRYRGSIARSK